jgi:DNA-directed RNA polymerase alpha subunit
MKLDDNYLEGIAVTVWRYVEHRKKPDAVQVLRNLCDTAKIPDRPEGALSIFDAVELLEFGTRTYNRVKIMGIRTIGELVNSSPDELLKCNGFGRVSLKELETELARHGFALRRGSAASRAGLAECVIARSDSSI